jgi:hypothetical protein
MATDSDHFWSASRIWVIAPVVGGIVAWVLLVLYPNTPDFVASVAGAWITEILVEFGFVVLPSLFTLFYFIVLCLVYGKRHAKETERMAKRAEEQNPPNPGGFA